MVILHEHVDTIKQRRFINNADSHSVSEQASDFIVRDVRGIP